MRAIWKGALSFGLVNVPVRVYAATAEHDIRFHQVHRADGGRIRYRRTCATCGDEVSYDDIAKGYELPGGETIVMTDEDLADLPLSSSREIDVLEFVPAEQVDPILFARTYYLEPDASAAKPYALLREALAGTERMAVAKVALRQRETLAALRVRGNAILLQTLLWPDEVREPAFDVLETDVELRPQELAMASSLVESMSTDFAPEQFTDAYRAALEAVIEAKAAGRDVVEPTTPRADTGGVVDLMTALQRSVDEARASRGSPAKEATAKEATAKEGPAKDAAAPKKAAAKKAAAPKKAAAKRTAAPKKSPVSKKAAASKQTPAKQATGAAKRGSAAADRGRRTSRRGAA